MTAICWDILSIDQTTDLKRIKRAYAKKVKHTRPDEKPDEFQELHTAYKQALALAKHVQYQQEVEDQEQAEGITNEQEQTSDIEKEVALSQEEMAYNAYLEQQYNELTQRCRHVIQNAKKRNDPFDWQFLKESTVLLEPQSNMQLGLFLLNEIFHFNQENTPKAVTRRGKRRNALGPNSTVKNETILLLDTIFNWSGQMQTIHYYLGDEIIDKILPALEKSTKNDERNAIASVKGGNVHEQNADMDNALANYAKAQESYSSIVTLMNLVTFILGIITLVYTIVFVDKGKFGLALLTGGVCAYLLAQLYGLHKKMRFAYYSAWVFACLSLFSFPIGTVYGGILIINLSRAKHLHNN